ncbi:MULTISPECIES: NuoI/complex I 23 kDa subunit family protein [Chloracidobacterium]|jgi:NADH-quinone oxidoreductase subunit I|uniref:NADH-quinone oxidoreductase subunit I n=1 Tax=Chloracidobacterium thermophilum (strain B) TaxID=981222 RepID=G2LF60_CHLTF|nr:MULTISPECIES: NADH-quinone oxidoreductase subunit I [Chloracidobacterium]AEP12988.1 NADH dehydrogenase subunit I [Chloracidobacterium thermophilum B]
MSSILSEIFEAAKTVRAIAQGMAVTLSYIPKQKLTRQYPDVPVELYPRFRGEHYLARDENGKERCVACFLCAAACPADAIYIEADEDLRPYAERPGMEPRYARVYNIDYGRCILCGYCVEACPKDAIKHGHNFEMAVTNFADLVKDKEYLLSNLEREKTRNLTLRSDA